MSIQSDMRELQAELRDAEREGQRAMRELEAVTIECCRLRAALTAILAMPEAGNAHAIAKAALDGAKGGGNG